LLELTSLEPTVGYLSRTTLVSVNSLSSLPTPSSACSGSWIGGSASSVSHVSTVIPVFKCDFVRLVVLWRSSPSMGGGSEPNWLLRDGRFHLLLKIIHRHVCHDDVSHSLGIVCVVLLYRVEIPRLVAGISSANEGYKNGGQAFCSYLPLSSSKDKAWLRFFVPEFLHGHCTWPWNSFRTSAPHNENIFSNPDSL